MLQSSNNFPALCTICCNCGFRFSILLLHREVSYIYNKVITMKKVIIGLALAGLGAVQVAGAQSVGTSDIQNGAVTTAKLKGGAVATGKIKANAVTSAKIKDGTIAIADLSPFVKALVLSVRDLEEYVEALQAYVEIDETTDPTRPTVRVVGANLQIVSGSGSTNGEINGLGNLIVGYDEENQNGEFGFCDDDQFGNQAACENGGGTWYLSLKSGSHNVVVGRGHSYASYGGVVVGNQNIISGAYSSVTGGRNNRTSGISANISGGLSNKSTGNNAAITGGEFNNANGAKSVVSGGSGLSATSENEWVAPLP